MVFTNENKILVTVLRHDKSVSAKKIGSRVSLLKNWK